jgi:FAD:protein FMN transferase
MIICFLTSYGSVKDFRGCSKAFSFITSYQKGLKNMKRIGLGFLLMIMKIISIVTGCGGQSTTEENETLEKPELTTTPYKKTEFLMGTVVTVKIYDKGKEAVLEPAFERIQTLADQITVNEAGSEINSINANASIQPVKVSKDIFELMDAGNAYSIQSNGLFDISIGPLTDLWRIGFPDARKPTQSEIDAVLPSIDYTQIELNKEEQTVF